MKKQEKKYFIFIIVILMIVLNFAFCKIEIKPYITKICGISVLTVSTGSMIPTISIGEVILTKEYQDYQIGDIITYQVDNQYLITHRVVKKDGNTYITKGDSNNIEDEQINKSQIEGKVIFHSKLLGKIKQYHIEIIMSLMTLIFIILLLEGGKKFENN